VVLASLAIMLARSWRRTRATPRCQQIRKHLPNLVAVNFYLRGEVFRVVETLNGLGER